VEYPPNGAYEPGASLSGYRAQFAMESCPKATLSRFLKTDAQPHLQIPQDLTD